MQKSRKSEIIADVSRQSFQQFCEDILRFIFRFLRLSEVCGLRILNKHEHFQHSVENSIEVWEEAVISSNIDYGGVKYALDSAFVKKLSKLRRLTLIVPGRGHDYASSLGKMIQHVVERNRQSIDVLILQDGSIFQKDFSKVPHIEQYIGSCRITTLNLGGINNYREVYKVFNYNNFLDLTTLILPTECFHSNCLTELIDYVSQLPSLTELHVHYCGDLGSLLNNFSKLRILNLFYYPRDGCTKLLDFSRISEDFAGKLTSLSVNSHRHVQLRGVAQFAQNTGNLQHLEDKSNAYLLREFSRALITHNSNTLLSYTLGQDMYRIINGTGFVHLIGFLSNLRCLHVDPGLPGLAELLLALHDADVDLVELGICVLLFCRSDNHWEDPIRVLTLRTDVFPNLYRVSLKFKVEPGDDAQTVITNLRSARKNCFVNLRVSTRR